MDENGTLRHGGRLHSAIEACTCAGLFRMSGNYILLQTPAFYPAVVEVPSSFLRSLYDMNYDWWSDHLNDNPDTPSPEDWYGAENGLDICQPGGPIWVERNQTIPDSSVTNSPRVGLNNVPEPRKSIPWRFRVCKEFYWD